MSVQSVLAGERKWFVDCGDALAVARSLPAKCIQTIVTSPPYFGLRDYGTASWQGGDAECVHSLNDGSFDPKSSVEGRVTRGSRDCCTGCGALRVDAQIGLESSPAEFVARLVELFAALRDALADDGTLWVNMGDSYSGSGKGGNPEEGKQATNKGSQTIGVLYGTGKTAREAAVTNVTRDVPGVPGKNLLGIPWRLAFALQADGWYLRQDPMK